MARKPAYRDSKEYQSFLKKVGYTKRKKPHRSVQEKISDSGGLKSGYAGDYYSDTGSTVAGKPLKQQNKINEATESPKILQEIKRKENLVRAINMPAPRDLSDDVPERNIDQSLLISHWSK